MYTIICFKELKQLGISYLLEDGTKKLGHVPLVPELLPGLGKNRATFM
jgi:hypothetical protein